MASNPMQRKARNSFLLGMLLMLVITGAIIALLFMQLMEKNKKEKEQLQQMVKAYVLKEDVKSGQVITSDMLESKTVDKTLVPSNATSDIQVIENYALQDKEGNNVITKTDKEGNANLYLQKDGEDYQLYKEDETQNYYIEKNNNKEYVELNSVPLVAKVTMKKNTLITTELLSKIDSVVQNDVRKQEYNMIVLPMDLTTGDYVDIRVLLPSGQDYIVVSKKEVTIPSINGVDSEDTIWINLTEDEILHMSCAIIDTYKITGAKIYATKYTEAGMQEAATPTYPLSENTTALLTSNPNILEKAMNEIRARYSADNNGDGNSDLPNLRNNYINGVIDSQGEQADSNVDTKMQESITNSKNERKEYLDSLAGVVE